MLLRYLASFALAMTSLGVCAAPTFIGSTINYEYRFPNAGTTYPSASNGNHVVDGGVEISSIVNRTGTIDIFADHILVSLVAGATFSTNGDFNGFRISDIFDTVDDFQSITVSGVSALDFNQLERLSFDANNIYVDMSGWSHSFATSFILNVGFGAPAPSPSQVPEPSSLALLGLGLAGLVARRSQGAGQR